MVLDKLFKYVDLQVAIDLFTKELYLDTISIDPRYALGYVVAETIRAPIDRPIYNISHLDGFAISSSDTVGASSRRPRVLKIVKEVDPRNAHKYKLKEGETVFVETGYPIPVNADAVIGIESVAIENDYIKVFREVNAGENIFPKASDISMGEVIASRGEPITPPLQRILIDLGIDTIRVYRKPRIAVIAVGSEIVDGVFTPSTTSKPGSSIYFVKSILEHYGCRVNYTGTASDLPHDLIGSVEKLLRKRIDLILTIGGTSLGPKDYSWTSLYKYFFPKTYFRGLKIQPGRSTSGLIVDGTGIINLPGLPVSTFSSLLLFVIPIVNYLRGLKPVLELPYCKIRLSKGYVENRFIGFHRLRFLKVNLSRETGTIIDNFNSYNLSIFRKANALTILKPGQRLFNEGEVVKAYYSEILFGNKTFSNPL